MISQDISHKLLPVVGESSWECWTLEDCMLCFKTPGILAHVLKTKSLIAYIRGILVVNVFFSYIIWILVV